MKEFAIFWGCTIQARFPFIEKSVRTVFEGMGLPYRDVDGFTCCPEKSLINNIDPAMWKLTAARNVAVVEDAGLDLVSPCTGCASNLSTVKGELNADPKEKTEVNELLGKVGREFKGDAKIRHLVPFFHDSVGKLEILKRVKRNFEGMKVGIHYGCHMMRPSHILGVDDPLAPVKFDNLVKMLGAESIVYDEKLTCCGQGFDRVDQHGNALKMARLKLVELRNKGADALVLCCPSCFLQFDNNQHLLEREGEKYGIPVLYYTDLLGLAMGFSMKELGLDLHRTKADSFVEKWEALADVPSPCDTINDGLGQSSPFI
jgi:CoB--CoM heterodisulfide reductase subunit B